MAPMEAGLSIIVDRFPDYFYLASLQGEGHKVIIAERDGNNLGTIGFSYRRVRLFWRELRISYIGGVKLLSSAMESTALYRMLHSFF